MHRRLMVVAGVVLVVVLLGAALVVPTAAQEPTPTPEVTCRWRGWGFGLWDRSWAVFDAVAEALGLAPEGLFSELHSGKTLDQVAEEEGVEPEAVKDAAQAAQKEAQKEAIQQAVEDGRLTQEQADWLLKGLDLGFWPMGGRFGSHRGMGFGFGRWMRPSTETSSS